MTRDSDSQARKKWVLAGCFMLLMVVTRYHHFGSIFQLPDASWAIFIAAGFYLRRASWFVLFLALAAVVDYFAITSDGTSGYCVTPAYPFLAAAYGALWLGGRWFARHRAEGLEQLVRLLLVVVIATAVCFLVSNGAMYWFSGRFGQMGMAVL